MTLLGIRKIIMCVILMISFPSNSSRKSQSINDVTSVLFSYFEPTHTETTACYNFSVVDPVKKQFFSPNYPNPYPSSITCILLLTAPPGHTITLDFGDRFDLENSSYCEADRLEVHDGVHEYSPLLGVFCGNHFTKKIFSTERYMWLRFTSDYSEEYGGFKAVYEFKDMNQGRSVETSPVIYSYSEPTHTETSACYNFSVVDPVKKQFFSPNYPNPYPSNITCILLITAASGQTITLDFGDRFDLEGSADREADRLEVHDGVDEYTPLLGVFCGNQFPKIIVSTGRYMWLRFTSDDSYEFNGFRGVYEFKDMENQAAEASPDSYFYTEPPTQTETSACYNFSVVDLVKKEFFSPNYPNPYPKRIKCILRITAPPGQIITLRFQDRFHLETSVNCKYDRLEVRDGTYGYSPLLGVFCGNHFTKKIVSTGRYMWLKFMSDHSVEYGGFKAVYEFKDMQNHVRWPDIPDINPEPTHTETSACYNFSVVDPVKKEFFSPNYPNHYPTSITCILRITAAPGQIITLDFLGSFNLEDSEYCDFDRLEVRDGAHEDSTILGVFCGHRIPKTIVSTTKYMWLKFTSDNSIEYAGFKAVYEFHGAPSACYNFSVVDPVKKEFFSPNYPNRYPNRITCIRLITAAPGQTITLHFRERFHLENSRNCKNDRLEVYDGEHEYSPLLGIFCGYQFPKKIISTGRYMWLRFKSDHSVGTSGFKAVYEFNDKEYQDQMSYAAPDTGNPSLQNRQPQIEVLTLPTFIRRLW